MKGVYISLLSTKNGKHYAFWLLPNTGVFHANVFQSASFRKRYHNILCEHDYVATYWPFLAAFADLCNGDHFASIVIDIQNFSQYKRQKLLHYYIVVM